MIAQPMFDAAMGHYMMLRVTMYVLGLAEYNTRIFTNAAGWVETMALQARRARF